MLIATALLSFTACTKLNEDLASETSTGGSAGGGGNVDVAALLRGAYGSLNGPFEDQTRWWACQEHTSDEAVGPTRGGDWDDNGIWRVYHNHRWTSEHAFLTDTYRDLAQAQFAATTVLDNNPSTQQAAEARFIRAHVMWAVLDGWDQVPYRATTKGDLTKTLPEVKKGSAAADFIISELEAALPNLPSGKGIGIASKDAAKALLMKLYLNRGVYTNRATPSFAAADMNKVISLADELINSGNYSLGTNFFDNFAPTNHTIGTELIYTLRCDNAAGFGGNNQFYWYCGLHYNQNPSGWNGFTTLGDFYDKFEAADKRRGGAYQGLTNRTGLRAGLLFGQQYDQNGAALRDRKNQPLAFTKEVALKETGNNLEVTGVRVIKYIPDLDANWPANNDVVILRLADILLMKAEAILRGGTATNAGPYGGTAASIVNFIRTHSTRGVAALGTVDLNAVYDERGRELYWEGWRRNDMVRFGKFLSPKQLKPTASGPERLLFPIPNEQLTINANLKQNPGY
ncbi:MAG: hypothetical protein RL316_251 [Bacteroidota bacterium]